MNLKIKIAALNEEIALISPLLFRRRKNTAHKRICAAQATGEYAATRKGLISQHSISYQQLF